MMNKSGAVIVVLTLVVVCLVVFGGYMILGMGGPNIGGIGKTDYQAVFLSNNQVYFGRIAERGRDSVELIDIYYLQVGRQLQGAQNSDSDESEVSLIKFGQEVHGPTDRMVINWEHVLFIEDLKEESKVVQAIRDYKVDK